MSARRGTRGPWSGRGSHGAVAVLATLALPRVAMACAVCGALSDRSRQAFFDMTMFMTFLPLGMLTVGVIWIRRNARGFLANEFEERDAGVTPPSEPPPDEPKP